MIVDDDEASRALVSATLQEAGYATCEAATGEDGLKAARREDPLLVVLAVCLPGISGYEVCHQLRERLSEGLPIILISGKRTEPLDRVAGLLIGADDYLVKPIAPDELIVRVRRLMRRVNPPASAIARLTAREREVLRLLADGIGQQEIADRLLISRKTVGAHMEHIFAKLEVHSSAQAVALAYREELIQTDKRRPWGFVLPTMPLSDLWEWFSAYATALPG